MAEQSGISWTDATFNPWMGCTKVSPACKNCYAERDMDHRYGRVAWGPSGTRVLTSQAYWNKPKRWNKDAAINRKRMRVFCASLADVFEDWDGPIKGSHGESLYWQSHGRWDLILPESVAAKNGAIKHPVRMSDIRQRLFNLIDETPWLDWLLLTKRPENVARMWHYPGGSPAPGVGNGFRPNIWLGTSVENQEYADKRLPHLHAAKRNRLVMTTFVSAEPLVGPVVLQGEQERKTYNHLGEGGLDWVITGGESGPDARPNHPEWFRSLRDQCKITNTPFHFKQWGEWVPGDHDSVTFGDDHTEVLPWHSPEHGNDLTPMVRVGVNRAGRLLDGQLYDSFPVGA